MGKNIKSLASFDSSFGSITVAKGYFIHVQIMHYSVIDIPSKEKSWSLA